MRNRLGSIGGRGVSIVKAVTAPSAIRDALEGADVEFTNGDEPGVKLKHKDESDV